MKLLKAVLRAYNGYRADVLPSTTIAGGLVYGMVINKDTRSYDIMFTNFYIVKRNGNKVKHYDRLRIRLDRVVNYSMPYLYHKLISKDGPYVDFQGYVISSDLRSVEDLLKKYLVLVGNNYTVFEMVEISEYTARSNELCVHNLPVKDVESLGEYRGYLRRITVQRFNNTNFLGLDRKVYYFDMQDKKVKEVQNDRNVLLCTFRYNESNEFGSFYNKFPGSLDSIEHYTKEYVKAGTGVIAPCDGY